MKKQAISTVKPFLCVWVALIAVATTATPVLPNVGPDDDVSTQISRTVDELITVLETEGIDVSNLATNPQLLQDIQSTLIKRLGDPTVDLRKPHTDAPTPSLPLTENEPIVVSKQLEPGAMYIRVRELNSAVLTELADIFADSDNRGRTFIWDLRFSQQLNVKHLAAFETFLNSVQEAPFVVLVNHDTTGIFELAARVLQNHQPCVVLGQPTAGRPYPTKAVPLSNGSQLDLPKESYTTTNGMRLQGPCVPNVVLSETTAYDELQQMLSDTDALRSDVCVRRALDLTKAYQLIGRKRF